MSRGINKVHLIGHLGRDPEINYTQSGMAVCNLALATSEEWTDKISGEKRSRTEWHRVVLWGKLAEIAGKYLRKGSQVYIEGRLETQKWQDQSGADRYTTNVVVDMRGTMQMLGSAPQNGQQQSQRQQQGGQQQGQPNRSQGQQNRSNNAPAQYNEPPMDFSDDIPF